MKTNFYDDVENQYKKYINKNLYKTGTTTLALKCEDGIVLGSDTRVTQDIVRNLHSN